LGCLLLLLLLLLLLQGPLSEPIKADETMWNLCEWGAARAASMQPAAAAAECGTEQ
jgi:hypothetical protein